MSDNKVTAAKPKIGGAAYRGTASATLPTDTTTALAGFTGLGYIGEDGLVNANSPESEEVKAWGGDVVLNVNKGRPDTFKFKLIEALKTEVLKLVYGDSNVTGTLETGIAIEVCGDDMPTTPFVFEMILKNGALKRICIPLGQLKSIGEITYSSGVVGYEVTISAAADSSGKTHYEYIKGASSDE